MILQDKNNFLLQEIYEIQCVKQDRTIFIKFQILFSRCFPCFCKNFENFPSSIRFVENRSVIIRFESSQSDYSISFLFLLYQHLIIVPLQCIAIPGLGFRRGSYRCICKRGFYYPDIKSTSRYYNGTVIEEEFEKLMMVSFSLFSSPTKQKFAKIQSVYSFFYSNYNRENFICKKKKKIHFDINLYKLYFLKISNEFFVQSEFQNSGRGEL